MPQTYQAKDSARQITPDQSDFMRRRVQPFADQSGVQTRPLIHLMEEAYLQGMTDAAAAWTPERDKLKTENDWLRSRMGGLIVNA